MPQQRLRPAAPCFHLSVYLAPGMGRAWPPSPPLNPSSILRPGLAGVQVSRGSDMEKVSSKHQQRNSCHDRMAKQGSGLQKEAAPPPPGSPFPGSLIPRTQCVWRCPARGLEELETLLGPRSASEGLTVLSAILFVLVGFPDQG